MKEENNKYNKDESRRDDTQERADDRRLEEANM